MMYKNDGEHAILERISQLEQRVDVLEQDNKTLKEENQFLKQENQKKDQRIEALEQQIQKDNAFYTKTLNALVQKTSHLRDIIFSDLSLQKRLRSNSEWFYYYTESEAINILNANGIFMKGRNSRAPKKGIQFEETKKRVQQNIQLSRVSGMRPMTFAKKILGIPKCCYETARRKAKQIADAMPELFEWVRLPSGWYMKFTKSDVTIRWR